jgi:hypothetical protein
MIMNYFVLMRCRKLKFTLCPALNRQVESVSQVFRQLRLQLQMRSLLQPENGFVDYRFKDTTLRD